jgi:hypothetical protein
MVSWLHTIINNDRRGKRWAVVLRNVGGLCTCLPLSKQRTIDLKPRPKRRGYGLVGLVWHVITSVRCYGTILYHLLPFTLLKVSSLPLHRYNIYICIVYPLFCVCCCLNPKKSSNSAIFHANFLIS